MLKHNIPKRTRVVSGRRTAWLVATAALFLACAADSPIGITERHADVINGIESNFSFSISPANRTVHVQFTRVRAQGSESVSEFVQRVFDSADAAGATRLVLDLSATRGGDSFLVVPLVKGILARDQFAKRGGLIVIVGPNTFSPSQNTAAMLQRYARPIFVEHPIT
jgi:sulfur relay (sulfurtransferase) DsrC/TusE family protein